MNFVQFLSPRRQTPEVWNFCVFTVFEFLPHPPSPEPPGDRNSDFLSFVVFYGNKLLRACLNAIRRGRSRFGVVSADLGPPKAFAQIANV